VQTRTQARARRGWLSENYPDPLKFIVDAKEHSGMTRVRFGKRVGATTRNGRCSHNNKNGYWMLKSLMADVTTNKPFEENNDPPWLLIIPD
jgi:hypothetical protein